MDKGRTILATTTGSRNTLDFDSLFWVSDEMYLPEGLLIC